MSKRLVFPHAAGLHHMRVQSLHGPKLPPGDCLGSLAHYVLGHPSGQDTALLGWHASTHKHPAPNAVTHPREFEEFLLTIPRAFPLWYDGGTPTDNHPEGDGHVTLSGVHRFNWSEDRLRTGFYDRVAIAEILTWNRTHPHHLLGWTEDIAGFMLPYKPHSKDAHYVS